MDSKFPFSWWPKKGILANPGFVRGGHWVYPKTRYRTWSEKARFELEVGDREIFDIGKFHRRNLRRKLVAKENILSKLQKIMLKEQS